MLVATDGERRSDGQRVGEEAAHRRQRGGRVGVGIARHRYRVGHMMVRHMWAEGLESKPRPCAG